MILPQLDLMVILGEGATDAPRPYEVGCSPVVARCRAALGEILWAIVDAAKGNDFEEAFVQEIVLAVPNVYETKLVIVSADLEVEGDALNAAIFGRSDASGVRQQLAVIQDVMVPHSLAHVLRCIALMLNDAEALGPRTYAKLVTLQARLVQAILPHLAGLPLV